MASPQTAQPVPQQEPNRNYDVSEKIAKADASTIARWVKFLNIVNALFLAASGVVSFITTTVNLLSVLSALYVIGFGLLLFCFECHLSRFDSMVHRNFGFMFKWQGRALFFLFTGTLAFGLGPMGIAAGCLTVAIIIFNIYVLRTNKSYSDQTDKDQQEMVTRVQNNRPNAPVTSASAVQPGSEKDANPFTVDVNMGIGGHNMTVPVSVSAADVTAAASRTANHLNNSDWEKIYDKGSGKYYFYNAKTQESRWELDGA
jgi:hypothetical protein